MTLNRKLARDFRMRIKGAKTRDEIEKAIKVLFYYSDSLVVSGTLCKKEEIDELCSYTEVSLTDSEKKRLYSTTRYAHSKRMEKIDQQKEEEKKK